MTLCCSTYPSDDIVFLGLSKPNSGAGWRWVDGTPFFVNTAGFYQPWSGSEPSGNPSEKCMRMRRSKDYGFGDLGCDIARQGLCESVGELMAQHTCFHERLFVYYTNLFTQSYCYIDLYLLLLTSAQMLNIKSCLSDELL